MAATSIVIAEGWAPGRWEHDASRRRCSSSERGADAEGREKLLILRHEQLDRALWFAKGWLQLQQFSISVNILTASNWSRVIGSYRC
jgi:hypothetical protein